MSECDGIALARPMRVVPEDGGMPPLHRLTVVFAASYEGGQVRPQEAEIAEVRWWDTLPGSLSDDAFRELSIEPE